MFSARWRKSGDFCRFWSYASFIIESVSQPSTVALLLCKIGGKVMFLPVSDASAGWFVSIDRLGALLSSLSATWGSMHAGTTSRFRCCWGVIISIGLVPGNAPSSFCVYARSVLIAGSYVSPAIAIFWFRRLFTQRHKQTNKATQTISIPHPVTIIRVEACFESKKSTFSSAVSLSRYSSSNSSSVIWSVTLSAL